MDVELATLIEEHLPLVKHVVFQVAAVPRHVDRDELAVPARLWSRRPVGTTKPAAYRSSARCAAIRGAILDAVRAADWAPGPCERRSPTRAGRAAAAELGRMPDKTK